MEFLSKSGLSFFKSLLDLYFATKSYVNKAISTNTGKFWGTYNTLADLQEITGSNGDYAYVIVPDDYSTSYDRYKWQDGQWVYEYTVGGEAFDDDQWAAINSGITSADKTRLNEISNNIGNNSISEMRSDIDANASEIELINEEFPVIAEALLYLYSENKALRELLTGKDNAVLPVIKAQTIECDDILTLGVPNVLYSSVAGAPSAANIPDNWDEATMDVWFGCPRKIGQQYVDKVSKKVYFAVAVTGSTSDWVVLN